VKGGIPGQAMEDKAAVLKVLEESCGAFDFRKVSEALRCDREVVLAAVKRDGSALEWAGGDFCNDREVVLAAVSQDGSAVKFADKDLREDEEIVLEALKTYTHAMQFAGDLQSKKDVVLKAMRIEPTAFQHVCERLRQDREVALEAVRGNQEVLKWTFWPMRSDQEIILAGTKQNWNALKYASVDLRTDKDFLLLAARCTNDIFTLDRDLKGHSRQFREAFFSYVAVRNQTAPIVTVTLSHDFADDSDGSKASAAASNNSNNNSNSSNNNNKNSKKYFRAEAVLMSGVSFICEFLDVPRTDPNGAQRSGPILNDLAAAILHELPKHMQADEIGYVFINFLSGQDGVSVAVTPWQWNDPLAKYLPEQAGGPAS